MVPSGSPLFLPFPAYLHLPSHSPSDAEVHIITLSLLRFFPLQQRSSRLRPLLRQPEVLPAPPYRPWSRPPCSPPRRLRGCRHPHGQALPPIPRHHLRRRHLERREPPCRLLPGQRGVCDGLCGGGQGDLWAKGNGDGDYWRVRQER
jgi:hypothetical protein